MLPLQDPDLEFRFPSISRGRCREELHVINERGEIFTGAAAVRETLARLPGASVMNFPFHVPGGMWMAERMYRWVARNREWLSRWLKSTTDD